MRAMIAVEEALQLVLDHASKGPSEPVPLERAVGLVLADSVVSSMDLPPFDRAMVDGYAVRAAEVGPGVRLKVVGEVRAGQVLDRVLGPGEAVAIMTGAPVPAGADAVIMVEQTSYEESSETVLLVGVDKCKPGENIMPRGGDLRAGTVLLESGRRVNPAAAAVAAAVGYTCLNVVRRPEVAVVVTGSELVRPGSDLQPGQIYESNSVLLAATLHLMGFEPSTVLGPVGDERDVLRGRIAEAIETVSPGGVVLITGGVSAGKADLVPEVLAELGVQRVFHKVRVRPGKPVWFGYVDNSLAAGDGVQSPSNSQGASSKTLVFGLPGNPVSSLVGLLLFVRPALLKMSGEREPLGERHKARLAAAHRYRSDRPVYWPGLLRWTDAGPQVQLLRWGASSDLRALIEANCLAALPAGERELRAGELVEVMLF